MQCRRCLDLWYASQRRGDKSRRYLQALKLRLRLDDTKRPMIVCVDKLKNWKQTSAKIGASGTARPIIRCWFPNDLGLCLRHLRTPSFR